MNNKILGIVFVVLVGIFLLSKFFPGKRVRSFDPEIVKVDTSLVDDISIKPKGDSISFSLKRNGADWMASRAGISTKAAPQMVSSLLKNLQLIRTDRITAKKEERWEEYEVDPATASHVVAKGGGKTLADLYVGRFNFNQQTRSATSYIRLASGPEIYAVDGLASMGLSQAFSNFRNKTLLKLNKADVTALDFSSPGSSFQIRKSANGQWLAGDGSTVDSAKVAQFLATLENVSGSDFADGFNGDGPPSHTLKIQGNNMPQGAEVAFYQSPIAPANFALRSSMNEAYFASDSTGLFQRLMKNLDYFQ
ncbi:MAG: DUF4340 domain-containing protein [Bacteroidota bacterium]